MLRPNLNNPAKPLPRPDGVDVTVEVEAERVVHGLSTVAVPPVARAAVGRRWATRATSPGFDVPG